MAQGEINGDGFMKAQVTLGNTCTLSSKKRKKRWEWRVFLDPKGNTFDRVVIHLIPIFKSQPYDLELNEDGIYQSKIYFGWGANEVGIELHEPGGRKIRLGHRLVFSDGGARSEVEIEVSRLVDVPSSVETEPISIHEAKESISRDDIAALLARRHHTNHADPLFWHGRCYTGPTTAPKVTWASSHKPRDDHQSPDWITASEYCDVEPVLKSKLIHVARLLKLSRKTVVYSGAGISRAAGIGQAARGGLKGGNKDEDAKPTFTHYALTELSKAGYIHGWVQQNHDGLPQKAGFPQEAINEIHGSWYDPSNPVVKYSGDLNEDLVPWMEEDAKSADLVLVLGTSLGGLCADQVATEPARRSLSGKPYERGGSLGSVLINLQQTEEDGKMSVRIFGESDDILAALLDNLGVSQPRCRPAVFKREARVLVPYDAEGDRTESAKMWLDLREGASVKLTPGHNIQGSHEPCYMHIGAEAVHGKKKGRKNGLGRVHGRKTGPGRGRVVGWDDDTVSIQLEIEGVSMALGQWWVDAAERGGPSKLPLVNINPEMVAVSWEERLMESRTRRFAKRDD